MYRGELRDFLWLEIQASHAERSPEQQDSWLCKSRLQANAIVNRIMDYSFHRDYRSGDSGLGEVELTARVNHSSGGSVTTRASHSSGGSLTVVEPDFSNIGNDLTYDGGFLSTQANLNNCSGCTNVFCKFCIMNQNLALKEVETHFDQLDWAERLYPTTKAFRTSCPTYASAAFENKFKGMCVWYNITQTLRLKVKILKKIIDGLGAKNVPFPDFDNIEDTSKSEEELQTDPVIPESKLEFSEKA